MNSDRVSCATRASSRGISSTTVTEQPRAMAEAPNPPGAWNTYEILVEGQRIMVAGLRECELRFAKRSDRGRRTGKRSTPQK